jgi:hypothetical protein
MQRVNDGLLFIGGDVLGWLAGFVQGVPFLADQKSSAAMATNKP